MKKGIPYGPSSQIRPMYSLFQLCSALPHHPPTRPERAPAGAVAWHGPANELFSP